jgi:ribosomal-protein-alanine N-acetyltransferase
MLHLLPYRAATHEPAVLALFHSNVPRYFTAPEEADLLRYLRTGLPYFVAVETPDEAPEEDPAGTVVAAGGYALDDDQVDLTWDLVHANRHGQGLGRLLTEFRLREAGRLFPHLPVQVETSQLTAGFYRKLGFQLVETQPDYWASGLDLQRMQYEPLAAAV